jgi:hypothetical protein
MKSAPRYKLFNRVLNIHTLFGSVMLVGSCTLLDSGENNVISEVYNMQESKKVILFIKESNATVDHSFQVSLTGYDYVLDKKDVGNIFVADSNHGQTVIDSSSVTAHWISNDSLILTYDKELRTFRKDSIFENVKILFREK